MEGKRYLQPRANQVRPPLYFRNIPYLHPKHPGLRSALPEAASHFFSPWLLPSPLLSWLLPFSHPLQPGWPLTLGLKAPAPGRLHL